MLHGVFTRFTFWGVVILNRFQILFPALSEQPRQKCISVLLFYTNIPALFWVRYCILMRGIDKYCIECLDKDKYITVYFIAVVNTYIMVHNKCREVSVVEGTGSQFRGVFR